jgi:DDE superfamily endonuclease
MNQPGVPGCTASGSAPRFPSTARSSAMRKPSPNGGPRPGRRHEASGADRRVDLLRGRGRRSLRPSRARTWAPCGHTPVVRVTGNAGRLLVAGMACLKPGRPARFFYRLRVHRRRKGERANLSEADYAHLISAAHHALNAPLIVIWDGLNTHVSRKMRAFTEARQDWLTVAQLPGYAPTSTPSRAPGQSLSLASATTPPPPWSAPGSGLSSAGPTSSTPSSARPALPSTRHH